MICSVIAATGQLAIPRLPPLQPAEAVGSFKTLAGFRMELLAAEPLLTSPVAGAYDENGRLYVAEMVDYPHVVKANDKPNAENSQDPPVGRVRLLVDRDGDGRFDASTVFADALSWPTGVAVWKGGVFVTATPDIWYFKDTDGDGRADVRKRVFTGFRKLNVQAVINNLQWGLDHRIYGAGSSNGGRIRTADQPDAKAVQMLRQDFGFYPETSRLDIISGGARFGNTFDDWGNRFLCDIRNPVQHVVLPAEYLRRNPDLTPPRALHDAALFGDALPVFRISPPEPWRELRARRWALVGKAYPRSELVGSGFVTSSSGVTVYRGDACPDEFHGNIFLGEVAGNLIHRQTLEPDGVTFRARRADAGAEFVASVDTWFRPVNFVNAPDGTLHVLDMYREVIEHPWSIPDDIKDQLDLRSGADRGRIYRLAPPGFRWRQTPHLGQATTAELVALLEHPNGWHRETAHRLIHERQDQSAVPALRQMIRLGKNPLGRLHALWSLDGLGKLANEDLAIGLNDASQGVREAAVRLSESHLETNRELRDRVLALASDPVARVRFQVAFTLGEITDPRAAEALATIARRDGRDGWFRAAVLSSVPRHAGLLLASLLHDREFVKKQDGQVMLRSIALVIGAHGGASGAERALSAMSQSAVHGSPDEDALLPVAVGLADGLRRAGLHLSDLSKSASITTVIGTLNEHATRLAASEVALPQSRVDAITLIGHRPFSESSPVLAALFEPRHPQAIQLAAARALAGYSEREVGQILLRSWRGLTPAVRTETLQILLSRSQWIGSLLDAIESGTVAAVLVPETRRAILKNSPDASIRNRARALFGEAATGPRGPVVARYQSALSRPGRRDRGQAIFERECLTCHRLGSVGFAVGPNLASVQQRSAGEVLIHILDPNREVAPDFVEYTVALKDGRVLSGIIDSETATGLTLRRAGGEADSVLRQEIDAITSTGRSLMPEGLESRLSPEEMSDLLTFLLEIQK
jgi:putative membrane-bound dehydrogenase-like protein